MLSTDTTVDCGHSVALFSISHCDEGFVVTTPTGKKHFMSVLPVRIASHVNQSGLISLVGRSIPGSETAQWLEHASANDQLINHRSLVSDSDALDTDFDQVIVLDDVDLCDRIYVFCYELLDAPPLYDQLANNMMGVDCRWLRSMALAGIYAEKHLSGIPLDAATDVTTMIPTKMVFLLKELHDSYILYQSWHSKSITYLIDANTVLARLANEELTPSDDIDSELVYLDCRSPHASKGKRPSHTASHTSCRVRGSTSIAIQKRQTIVGKLPSKVDPLICTTSLKDIDVVPRDRVMIKAHKKSNPRCAKPCENVRGLPKSHDDGYTQTYEIVCGLPKSHDDGYKQTYDSDSDENPGRSSPQCVCCNPNLHGPDYSTVELRGPVELRSPVELRGPGCITQ